MANPFTSKAAPAGIMPGEWDWQDREIQRQMKMAEALREENSAPIQGQMIGGIYVAPSWTQHLAKALAPLSARKLEEDAAKKYGELAESRRTERADTLSRMAQALQGTPEKRETLYFDDAGVGSNAEQVTPAVPGSREAAMGVLGQSRDPELQRLYTAQMLKGLEPKKPVVVGRSLLDPETGKPVGVDQTWQAEQAAARQQRMEELNMRLNDQRTSREEANALRRELAQMGIEARKEMAGALGKLGGEKAPAGYRFNPDGSLGPIPGGPADPRTKTGPDGMPKLTESQGKANLYQSRATESDKIMSDLEGQYSPLAINAKQGAGKVWGVGGALESVANVALPKNAQKVEQAQRDFVNAILRQESGAVISDQEFANAQKQYFPQPGDSQAVIDQKRKNRATAIQGLRVMAGPAATMNQPQPQHSGFRILGVE